MGDGLQTASGLISAGLIVGRMAHSRLSALTGHCDALLTEPLPSGLRTTGSRLIVGRGQPPLCGGMAHATADGTFGSLPLPSVIPSFQCPGLRKHPGVGRNDLLSTSAQNILCPLVNPTFRLSPPSSGIYAGVVDDDLGLE